MQIIVLLITLVGFAPVSQKTPTNQSKPVVIVEVRCGGDDNLTQGVCSKSMRLYLGAALLKAGRAREAEAVYREDRKEFRNNGWTLFGLAQSLRAQGKTAAAQKLKKTFSVRGKC